MPTGCVPRTYATPTLQAIGIPQACRFPLVAYGSQGCCDQYEGQPGYVKQGDFFRVSTDAAGKVYGTVFQGSATPVLASAINSYSAPAQVCLSNCGQGTGFLGFGGTAADIGRTVAGLLSQLAISLTPIAPFYAAGSALAESAQRSQQGMSLNIAGILGAAGSILGGSNLGMYSDFGRLAGGALQLAGAALTPQPQQSYGPIYSPQPVIYQTSPIAQPTAAGAVPAFAMASGRIAAIVAPILAKIAVKVGLRARPSLTRAMDMVRKAAKLLQSPEAVAAALGITVAELATLITTSNSRKRRRMNPANSKALKRAARRIKSFHRLCTHTDVLKGRSRGSRARSVACGSCKKSPCRC